MGRLPDWEARLGAYLASKRHAAFVWGENDCVLFATGAAAAITGVDKAAEFRGQYADKKGAAAILKRLGEGTLLRTLNARFPRRKPALAQRGDLVWYLSSVGVCIGGDALFMGEERLTEGPAIRLREGLITVPRRLWTKAWAV